MLLFKKNKNKQQQQAVPARKLIWKTFKPLVRNDDFA